MDCSWSGTLSNWLTGGRSWVNREKAVTTPIAPRTPRIARAAKTMRASQPAADGLVRGSPARLGRAWGWASDNIGSGDGGGLRKDAIARRVSRRRGVGIAR